MSDRAEVVVIGGGIMGACAALHLAEAGVGRVRLIERDGLAQGTTSAGAGFVTPWATGLITGFGEQVAAVEQYALEFYRRLAEDNHQFDYAANGVLCVAPDDAAWKSLEPLLAADGRVERVFVSAEQVEELTGVIQADGVVAGILLPEGAQVSAAKAAHSVAVEFERKGGTVDVRRPAVGLRVERGRVVGVETSVGRIGCDAVVLAAGVWNRELLRPLGVVLPTVPLVTSRIMTEPVGIPGSMPALYLSGVGPGDGIWARGHQGALLWGGVYKATPRFLLVDAHLPERLDQLPLDGVLEVQRAGREAWRFMPVLARYRSLTVAHGAPCYTTDSRALVGPLPGIDGLHVIAGDNEAGITHAPGYGKALAQYIAASSKQPGDLAAWQVDRFGDQFRTEADIAEALGQS